MTDNDFNLKPQPTPGPWHVGAGLMVCASDGSAVARCASTRGKFEYEKPNAYLIAAAPELLEILQAVYDWQHGHGSGIGCTEADMRALIAKAKGGAA